MNLEDAISPTVGWLVAGFALMALELVSGAAVLIFCGLGALAVGLLLAVGVDLSFSWQVILAAGLSVFSVLLLRPLCCRLLRPQGGGYTDHVGAVVVVETPVGHESPGTVLHRGTVWQARAARDERLAAGEQAVVVGVEGIELQVRRV